MAQLFPDQHLHVGGDEVTSDSWLSDRSIQAYLHQHGLQGSRGLQAHFTTRVLAMVTAHGRTPVGWGEITRAEPDPGAVVRQWMPGVDPGPNRVVLSEGFYLDRGLSAGRHHAYELLGALLAPSLARALLDPPEVGTRLEDVLQPESDAGRAFLADVEPHGDDPVGPCRGRPPRARRPETREKQESRLTAPPS